MQTFSLITFLQNQKLTNWKLVLSCIIVCVFASFSVGVLDVSAADSFGDPFDGAKLKNKNWKWTNEPPKWDVGKTREGFLYIDSEANRNLWAGDASHFLYQETDTDMFDVETQFVAKWDTTSAVNGLLVKSPGDNNWVTIKFWSRDAGPKGQIQYQTRQAGMGPPDVLWKDEFGDFGDALLALRLKKEGDTYTAWYKTEGDKDWVDIGQGNFTLNPPLQLGIYAGVAAGAGKLEVEYEYFNDNMNPFPVEPGGKATTTWGDLKRQF